MYRRHKIDAMDLQSKAHHQNEFITHDLAELSTPYQFLSSIIVPRPIAFITTKDKNGIVNAAPFSFFNAVCSHPPIISVAIGRREGNQRKDTSHNIHSTKEFVINICSIEHAKAVSLAGKDYPPTVSEIDLTNLSLIPSVKISVPRIANTLIQMECHFLQSIEIGEHVTDLILGQVVNAHLHKDILTSKGRMDFEKLNPLVRLAGTTYAKIHEIFDIFP